MNAFTNLSGWSVFILRCLSVSTQSKELPMEQKKKGSPRSKEPETLAEYLRQSKGLLLPKRIEGKPKGAAISTRRGKKG